jgi:quinohemoprotein ethanol dehydrogenase
MRVHLKRLVLVAMSGALLFPASLSAQTAPRPSTQELAQTKSGGADWVTYGGALNNERYSTLDQINTTNVGSLKGAWLARLGSGRGSKYIFEAEPRVIDGIMYIPTGNDDIFALDATSGKKLWEWDSDVPQTNDLICCGWDNRGVAVGEGMVFSGVLDGSFVALDQKTGRLAWRTQLEDYHDGFSITGAPRYYDGLVLTGMSGAENGIRGRIYALDAKTGKEVWRFYNIPAPGEFGSNTWPSPNDPDPIAAQAWQHGGASVWQSPTIDPELGMMYYSTGNGAPTGGGFVRAGDNLFAASIVALDYRTGQYKWHFQEVHHDIWDYDAPSPTVLFDQMYNGVLRKGIYQCGKTGWCYFLDRTNGQPLIGIDEVPVPQEPRQATSPTQPRPVGDPFVPLCAEPLPNFPLAGCNLDGFWDVPLLMPASSGNWSPTSYNVQTGYVYVMGGQALTARATHFVEYERGKRYSSSASVTPPDSPIKNTLTALDSRTNKIVWQHTRDGDRSYGAVSTAGGLVFVGQIDGNLVGMDARSGNELWKFQTGWGISAPPITYSVNGQQYVAVASGGNRGGVTTLDGDAVWAFALNGSVDEVAAPPPVQTKAAVGGALIHLGEMVGGVRALVTTGGEVVFNGTISTEDYLFNPVRVGVPVGTTLTWENRGSVVHTATDNRGTWDTGDIPSGQSRSVTFNTAGTYNFSCNPHPWMLGQVVVQ